MVKNIIELPDGSRISSGAAADRAIMSCTVTDTVNGGPELTIGSVCSAMLEATVIVKDGQLGLAAGSLIKLYKADGDGAEVKMGAFRLEQPTKKAQRVYQITAYDLITRLDKDLSAWLKSFAGWGCTLVEFADAVCTACGLQLGSLDFPNRTFPVRKFSKPGVTGRQIMSWIGQIAGCYCRVDEDGFVVFGWYADSGVTVRATGPRHFFSKALTYEDYEVAAVDAVQLRLSDGDNGALWPEVAADNSYIIEGNAILSAKVTDALKPYLRVIQDQLAALPAYRPCKVSLPASLDIRAGDIVHIEDGEGVAFAICVMTKTQSGQQDTLECTGSARRDSTRAANNHTASQVAQQAVASQTRQSIFNQLTENGQIQGLYVQDGKWYINAELVKVVNLVADLITAGCLKSADGNTYFDLDEGKIRSASDDSTAELNGGFFKVYNKNGKPVFESGSEAENGILGLAAPNGDLGIVMRAYSGHVLQVRAYDADMKGLVTYNVGFREVGGVKVLAQYD